MEPTCEARLDELTLEEKVTLVSGADMWHTAAVERLGIPALWMSDGPNGVRGLQLSGAATAVCFPCGAALGATFDPALVRRVGEALGLEARRTGVHVLLGPTINTVRLPIAGRNFECFSEDPYLSAQLAASYVDGVQSMGVAAVPKHFVANDSERERYTTSSDVDEAVLREVYLAPFEAAVRTAGAWAVMSSYNRVNGTYACEHAELLRSLLKGEWAFDGVVVSDWYGTTSTVAAALAGLDVEMPGPALKWGEALLEAVRAGEVGEDVLDDKVRRVLRLVDRTTGDGPSDDGTSPAALIRSAAADATVLLHNRAGLLPLDPSRIATLAVVGPNAAAVQVHGGGSARVVSSYVVSPLEALTARLGTDAAVRHEPGCSIARALPVLDERTLAPGAPGTDAAAGDAAVPCREPVAIEYFANPDLAGAPHAVERVPSMQLAWNGPPVEGLEIGRFSVRIRATLVPAASGTAQFGLLGIGRTRLFVDGTCVIDNWEHPAVAPLLFGRGAGEIRGAVEVTEGVAVPVVVELQAPSAELARQALEMSPLPPSEESNSASHPAGVTVGYLAPGPSDLLGRAEALARESDVVVVVVGTNEEWESEGFDRDELGLPGDQDELVARLCAVNDHVVVVVNAGCAVAMPWADDAAAVLQLWLPGQEAGNALADVLFGDTDPAGRLPVTIPFRLEDSGAADGYPAEGGRLEYREGLDVGYRHFDAAGIAPRYPFGHGLSYTTFTYGELAVVASCSGEPDARVVVTNTGARRGAEVVQLYVGGAPGGAPGSTAGSTAGSTTVQPPRALKGVEKVWLEPGEARSVTFGLDASAFASFDPSARAWAVEAREVVISVGASSRDLRGHATVRIDADGRLA
ncbi:MAG: glycoside hydrolase family 3 protein [Acidimicrobiales bacterium]